LVERAELRIGEVAASAGVSVDTVRYYERLKLLPRGLYAPCTDLRIWPILLKRV